MFRIEVYDKRDGRKVWHEDHHTQHEALTELGHMQRNHFNPKNFTFKLRDMREGTKT